MTTQDYNNGQSIFFCCFLFSELPSQVRLSLFRSSLSRHELTLALLTVLTAHEQVARNYELGSVPDHGLECGDDWTGLDLGELMVTLVALRFV